MRALSLKGAATGVGERYVAWDIETRGFRHDGLLCICAVAETETGDDDHEIVAHTFPEFIRELRKLDLLRHDVAFFAHAGGIFDHIFALQELLPEWTLHTGIAAGGFGAWSLDLRSPDGKWLRLRDSFRLMPSSLDAIGKAFGEKKHDTIKVGGVDIPLDRGKLGDYWDAGAEDEVKRYCLQDCKVLMKALRHFREVWEGMGIAPRATVASTSTARLRMTVPSDNWGWTPAVDRLVESAYHGGRTERFLPSIGESNYYDVVSSYPAAMSEPLPTRFLGEFPGERRPGKGECAIYLARVVVYHNVEYPCLPYVPKRGALSERLVFPTGAWRALFVDEELECAQRHKAVGDVRIERTFLFRAEPFLADFMQHWYRIKDETKDPALKYIAKIALNSVSGKLIENPRREFVTSDSERYELERERGLAEQLRTGKIYTGSRDLPHIKTRNGEVTLTLVERYRIGSFRHAAAAAFVTARGRVRLYEGIMNAKANGGRVAYCDTDSVVTDTTIPAPGTLGTFKHEHSLLRGEFLRPKLYALFLHDGRIEVRAKGMRISRHVLNDPAQALEVWQTLSNGEEFIFETGRKLKTAMRKRDLRYAQDTIVRRLRKNHDKRRFCGACSVPWSVDELESLRPLERD
jgi:hypothetical protein